MPHPIGTSPSPAELSPTPDHSMEKGHGQIVPTLNTRDGMAKWQCSEGIIDVCIVPELHEPRLQGLFESVLV